MGTWGMNKYYFKLNYKTRSPVLQDGGQVSVEYTPSQSPLEVDSRDADPGPELPRSFTGNRVGHTVHKKASGGQRKEGKPSGSINGCDSRKEHFQSCHSRSFPVFVHATIILC